MNEMRKAISEMVISFRFILICRMLLSYYRFIMATSAKKGTRDRTRRVCSRFSSLVNRPTLMSSWIGRRRQLCHSGNAGMPLWRQNRISAHDEPQINLHVPFNHTTPRHVVSSQDWNRRLRDGTAPASAVIVIALARWIDLYRKTYVGQSMSHGIVIYKERQILTLAKTNIDD